MDITAGSIVFSKAGRDKGNVFLVLEVKNGFSYIADGSVRKVEKPKKKKLIHLQRTNYVFENISKDIENCQVRKIIAQYKTSL